MAIPCGSGRMAGRLAVEIGRDAEASARWRSVTRGPSARVAGGPAASESPTGGSVLHTALDADPTWEPVSGGACAPAAARGLDQRLRGGSGDPTKIQVRASSEQLSTSFTPSNSTSPPHTLDVGCSSSKYTTRAEHFLRRFVRSIAWLDYFSPIYYEQEQLILSIVLQRQMQWSDLCFSHLILLKTTCSILPLVSIPQIWHLHMLFSFSLDKAFEIYFEEPLFGSHAMQAWSVPTLFCGLHFGFQKLQCMHAYSVE